MGIGTVNNRTYGGIILGVAIRGQIAKTRIFRFRRGNGYYNANVGTFYQDQYDYFVPTSITDAAGDASRAACAAGVTAWQTLSDTQKQVYNDSASMQGLRMSGYNLFMRNYIKANA